MAALVFNIAKGRVARYADAPEADDGWVAVLLQAAGLEADAVLRDYDTLADLLAGASNEATFTGYARQALVGVAATLDDATDQVLVDCNDPSWSPTTAQAVGKVVFCYDPSLGAGTDADIVPVFADDYVLTTPTSGTITYTVADGGFVANT